MKIKIINTCLVAITITFLFSSCENSSNPQTELQKIQSCIEKNIKSVNDEDIDAYMNCLSTKGTNYANTKQEVGTAFRQFDIVIKLTKMDIKFESDEVAIVSLVEEVTYINPPGPPTNVVMKNKLVKENGEWKILDSSMMQ